MEEIRKLSKVNNFSNFIYHYKSKNVPEKFLFFKGPLVSYKIIKEIIITLGEAEEEQKEFRLELSEIVKGSKKSVNQKSAISNIKTL